MKSEELTPPPALPRGEGGVIAGETPTSLRDKGQVTVTWGVFRLFDNKIE